MCEAVRDSKFGWSIPDCVGSFFALSIVMANLCLEKEDSGVTGTVAFE